MFMAKMEIELTDEQLEKVELLKKQGIDVGEAIDLLFEVKEGTLSLVDNIDEDIKVLEKIMDLDVDKKAEILDENYGDAEKTYEMRVQDTKHKISWVRDVFKF